MSLAPPTPEGSRGWWRERGRKHQGGGAPHTGQYVNGITLYSRGEPVHRSHGSVHTSVQTSRFGTMEGKEKTKMQKAIHFIVHVSGGTT